MMHCDHLEVKLHIANAQILRLASLPLILMRACMCVCMYVYMCMCQIDQRRMLLQSLHSQYHSYSLSHGEIAVQDFLITAEKNHHSICCFSPPHTNSGLHLFILKLYLNGVCFQLVGCCGIYAYVFMYMYISLS